VNVLVCDLEQPVEVITPSLCVIVTAPQASVAVALPNALLISDAAGLQPSVVVVPLAMIDGGVLSFVHVMVLAAVAELPQPSMAVKVLVCEALQEVVATAPSVNEMVGVPQPSVAVAVPSAAVISDAVGLQPKVVAVPVVVIDGGVISTVLVIV